MAILPSVLIFVIPVIAVFVCMAVLVDKFSVPKGLLAVLLGVIVVIPAVFVQYMSDSILNIKESSLAAVLLRCLVINGLIEETVKMGALFCIPSKKLSPLAFVTCGILAGLSFSSFESLMYMSNGMPLELRLLTSFVIHGACTGLSAIFVYSVKQKDFYIFPFIVAVCCHGVFNYFAGFKTASLFFGFSIIVVLVSVAECRIRYRTLVSE